MPAHNNRSAKVLALQLDRVFGEMNAFLLAVAIGLAALDATCFVATKYADLLHQKPLLTRMAPAAEPAIADAFVSAAR